MNRIGAALAAGLLAVALVGCAEPPQPKTAPGAATPTEALAEPYKACLATEAGEPAEGSPVAQALAGLERAQVELGIETNHVTVETAADYARVIQSLVDSQCDIVLGLGSAAADPFEAAAKTNPDVEFALVDATPNSAPRNLRPVLFSTHESGFLAGYLAAANSTTGKVGAFGALNLPAVTVYLDGFVQGVEHYNTAKSGHVEALGWNLDTQDGTFVRSATGAWQDPAAGRAAAKSLTDQDADVVLAVAGQSGVGALELAQELGDVQVIWSDTDGCLTQAGFCDQLLTSVVKDRGNAVFEVIDADQSGRSAAGIFTANLRNEGTHLTDDVTSAELDALTRQIINGTIEVASPSAIG